MNKQHEFLQQYNATLLNVFPDSVIIIDNENNIINCNCSTSKIFNKTCNEIIGGKCYELFHQTNQPIAGCPHQKLLKSKKRETMELQIDKKWYLITADPILSDSGELLGCFHLARDKTKQKQAENIKAVIISILEAVTTTKDLPELFGSIHDHLSSILDVKNFYVAFLDEAKDLLNFPYYHDEKVIFNSVPASKTLTKFVIKTNEPLFADESKQKDLHDKGLIGEADEGTEAKIWIGVPLSLDQKVIGAVSVQSYDDDTAFTLEDMQLLELVSDTIALAITRKQNVQALQESEEKFRLLYDNTVLGMYRTTPAGKIIIANKALIRMLGYDTSEELKQRNLEEEGYDPNYQRDHFKTIMKMAGEVKGLESTWKKKDGRLIYVRENAKTVFNENGEIIFYDGVVEDITEKKKMEIALRESEEKYRGLFDNSTDIIFTLDSAGKITEVNSALESIAHYKREEILGIKFLNLFSEENKKNLIDVIESMKKNGKPILDFQLDIIRRNGERLFWELSLSLIKKDDIPFGFQGSLRDVTKRQEAEQELIKYHDHLKLINSILRHDIANCFTVINSAINIYRRNQDLTMLDEAVLKIKKGISLINKMKQLEEYFISRSDLKKVDLVAMLDDIASQYSNLKTTIIGKATVLADEALESTFDNLFTNAFKHGKATEIEIKITNEKKNCQISFADNGSGIVDKIKAMIFEKAFKSGTTGNTGLGLYIVKKTIDRYGGSIEVDDNEPQGAKFIIELRCMK